MGRSSRYCVLAHLPTRSSSDHCHWVQTDLTHINILAELCMEAREWRRCLVLIEVRRRGGLCPCCDAVEQAGDVHGPRCAAGGAVGGTVEAAHGSVGSRLAPCTRQRAGAGCQGSEWCLSMPMHPAACSAASGTSAVMSSCLWISKCASPLLPACTALPLSLLVLLLLRLLPIDGASCRSPTPPHPTTAPSMFACGPTSSQRPLYHTTCVLCCAAPWCPMGRAHSLPPPTSVPHRSRRAAPWRIWAARPRRWLPLR